MVCWLNIVIRIPPADQCITEAIQAQARVAENGQRKAIRRYSFSKNVVLQCQGPLQQLFLPKGAYRGTRGRSYFGAALREGIEVDSLCPIIGPIEAQADCDFCTEFTDDNFPMAVLMAKQCLTSGNGVEPSVL